MDAPFEALLSTTVPDNTPNDNATILGIPQLSSEDAAVPRYAGGRLPSLQETTAGFPSPSQARVAPGEGSAVPAAETRSAVVTRGEGSRAASASAAERSLTPPAKPKVPPKPHLAQQRGSEERVGSSVPALYSSKLPSSASGPQASANWPELYEQLGSAEKRRALRELQRKADLDALAEYERWAKRTVAAVMEDLSRTALTRAAELLEATGKHLEVEYPSGPTVVGASGDAEIRFLKLSLGKACVHVYSSHARGSTTHIHLLPAFTDSLKKNHRLVSEPGAFVVRRPDDGYELRYFRGDPNAGTAEVMNVDTLLYKALRLLVRCADDE